MVGLTLNGSFMPGYTSNGFNCPNLNLLPIQNRTLLNVQFHISIRMNTPTGKFPGIADALQLTAKDGPISAFNFVSFLERQKAAKSPAAKHVNPVTNTSSFVNATRVTGRSVSMPASFINSITSNPAITPTAPSNRPPVGTVLRDM